MSGSVISQREGQPVLILTCQRDSHPFQERTIILNEVLKVGRSVARVKPASNNAIFDCKVLSRSHALIWYRAGRVRFSHSVETIFCSFGYVIQIVVMVLSSTVQELSSEMMKSMLIVKYSPVILSVSV